MGLVTYCDLCISLQAQAQAQAQQAAEEACHLDAAAQQLQAEAHLVGQFKGSLSAAQQHDSGLPYANASAAVDYMQASQELGEQAMYTTDDQQMRDAQVISSNSCSQHVPCLPWPILSVMWAFDLAYVAS